MASRVNRKDKILNFLEDFKPRYSLRPRWIALLLLTSLFYVIHQLKDKFACELPELVNIFSHIGNVDSVIPTLLVGLTSGYILARFTKLEKKQLTLTSLLLGLLVGVTVNVLIETQFGMELVNQPNISDPLDTIYGSLFCLATLLVTLRLTERD